MKELPWSQVALTAAITTSGMANNATKTALRAFPDDRTLGSYTTSQPSGTVHHTKSTFLVVTSAPGQAVTLSW